MALPNGWIERIFARLTVLYGAKFHDQWAGIEIEMVKDAWAEDLAGFSGDEIASGLDACKRRPWPPTLPEFLLLCRPLADAEALFVVAQRAMSTGDWQRNRLAYWVAQAVGWSDVRHATWPNVRKRWENAMQQVMGRGELPEIPAQREALPSPGASHSRETAQQHLAAMRAILGMGEGAA